MWLKMVEIKYLAKIYDKSMAEKKTKFEFRQGN